MSSGWQCPKCTFANKAYARQCEVCHKQRGNAAASTGRNVNIGNNNNNNNNSSPWTCKTCTYKNTGFKKKCDICNTMKPVADNRLKDGDVTYIVKMGFTKEQAAEALKKSNYNRNNAIRQLLKDQAALEKKNKANAKKKELAKKKALKEEKEREERIRKENIKKKKTEDDKKKKLKAKRELEIQLKIEEERAEKRRAQMKKARDIEEAKKREEMKKSLEERKIRMEAERKAKKKRDFEARMIRIREEEAHFKELEQKKKARELAKKKKEARIGSIEEVIQSSKIKYSETRFQQFIQIWKKVLEKILAHPDKKKFRALKASSQKISELIIRPRGGEYILHKLGFIYSNDTRVWKMEKVDVDNLKGALKTFNKYYKKVLTKIPILLKEADEKKTSPNAIYFSLERILYWIEVIERVDTSSDAYVWLKKCDLFMKLVEEYFDTSDGTRWHPLKKRSNDSTISALKKELRVRIKKTTIAESIDGLIENNKWEEIKKLVEKITSVMNNNLKYPLDKKFKTVSVHKLFKRGPIDGGKDFLKAVSIKIDETKGIANVTNKMVILQHKYNLLQSVWNTQLKEKGIKPEGEKTSLESTFD